MGFPRHVAARRWLGRLGGLVLDWLHDVEVAAMARYDAVELGQRLDLVDDHAAHLGRAFGSLLWQSENAPAQLVAHCFDLTAHLGPYFLQLFGEVLRHLREHRTRLVRHLFVLIGQGLGWELTFPIGAAPCFVPNACKSDNARNEARANEIFDLASAAPQKYSGIFLGEVVSP